MKSPLLVVAVALWLTGLAAAREDSPSRSARGPATPCVDATGPPMPSRTSGAPAAARRAPNPPVLELLDGPVSVSGTEPMYLGTFSTAGARVVGLRLQASNSTGENCAVVGGFEWRWTESGDFFTHTFNDRRLPPPPPGGNFAPPEAYVFFVLGEQDSEAPLFIFPQGLEARVYLRSGGECAVTVDSVQVWLQR